MPISYFHTDYFLKYDSASDLFDILDYNIEFRLEDIFQYKKDILKSDNILPVEEIFKISDDIRLVYYPRGFYGEYIYRYGYAGGNQESYAYYKHKNKTSNIFLQPGNRNTLVKFLKTNI